jgi:formylglycine-generating enzyme required for sulfatase activity
MRRLITFAALVLFGLAALAAPAAAEKRVALVIGNSAYKNVGRLANPVNDATAMTALLKAAGFTVSELRDAGLAAFRRGVSDFSVVASDADIAVVYFAGHGIEVDRANYLIPVDAKLERDFDVADETVALDRVLQAIEPARRLRLVILDACRNNPFIGSMQRGTRSVGRGLVRVDPPAADTLVAFAAKEGTVADDGLGKHSPFTAALLKHLTTPGLDIRLALGEVRDEVRAATQRKQEPFVYGSLGGKTIALVSAPPPAAPPLPAPTQARPPSAPDPCADAGAHFRAAEAIGSKAAFEDHVSRFPDCNFAGLARARLAALIPPVQPAKPAAPVQSAVVAPPVVPVLPPSSTPKPAVGVFPPAPGATPLSPERERALRPKDTFKECDTCPEMVVVPAGSFTMGSPAGEAQRGSDEGPQRRVTFSRQFAVGKLAVTFDEWDACAADGGCTYYGQGYVPSDEGWGRGRRPVINISWDDAKAYLAWLSRKTGKTYRLLSEAEREYVARAGSTTPFWWGWPISTSQANYDGNHVYSGGSKGENRQKTVPVDSFQPNPWGLYQVHGNVREWVEDCHQGSYGGAPTDGLAWISGDCTRRGLRGGSWLDYPWDLRSARRLWYSADYRKPYLGFRVARTLSP